MRDIAKFAGAVAVMALMGWLVTWAASLSRQYTTAQAREGLKDGRTAVLPVPLTK